MSDTKRKRGGQWLFEDCTPPRKYTFKAHPALADKLERAQADLEAYDITASKSGIIRFIVDHTIDNAVSLIRAHIEGHAHGTAEP